MTTRSTPRKRTPAVVIEAVPVVVPVAALVVIPPTPAPAAAKASTLDTLSAINEVMMVPTYLALALVFVPVNWLTGRYSR